MSTISLCIGYISLYLGVCENGEYWKWISYYDDKLHKINKPTWKDELHRCLISNLGYNEDNFGQEVVFFNEGKTQKPAYDKWINSMLFTLHFHLY